ncbi:class II aldolase/adducin family protein [Desulfogranum japonicum]|uniref:class II aldolase/adducin family protein n=1 Tax=Desulfogranum japonicum TaxID=231447 RepID=UPI00041787C4|nr:class II aldolase/adducin family protein [Desulfogranum japonicum]
MKTQKMRKFLLHTAREMNACGLNQGTAGNISVWVENGFLITPSALPYVECTEEDMVLVKADGTFEGIRKPSSEWRLHRDLYLNHPQSRAVLHAHSPWCTTLACLERDIPAFHYMVAMAGGDHIPCTAYRPFGSQELSDSIVKTMGPLRACLMGHHGMICHTVSPDALLPLAIEVESLARIYVQMLQINPEPPLLSPEDMREVLERFATYKP